MLQDLSCSVPLLAAPRNQFHVPLPRHPRGDLGSTSLAANAYQLPLGRRCDRRSAASMTAGAASRYVGRCAAHRCSGSTSNGIVFDSRALRSANLVICCNTSNAFREPAQQRRCGPGSARSAVRGPRSRSARAAGSPLTIRLSRRVPSARQAGRCGCRRRPAPGALCGVATPGRSAKSPGANRGQSLRHNTFSRRPRGRGFGIQLVQALQQPVAQVVAGRCHRVGVQFDDRSAVSPRPVRRFAFVALQHADVVQRRSPAGPDERRPVGVHLRSSQSRCTTNGGAVASAATPLTPAVVAEARRVRRRCAAGPRRRWRARRRRRPGGCRLTAHREPMPSTSDVRHRGTRCGLGLRSIPDTRANGFHSATSKFAFATSKIRPSREPRK